MTNLLYAAISGFWKCLTAIVVLFIISQHSDMSSWVWKYFIPVTLAYWTLYPIYESFKENNDIYG